MVHTKVDPRLNGGADVAAALVTRIKSAEDDNEVRVNLRVFLDTGADLRLTNVLVRAEAPDDDADNIDTDVSGTQRVAWTKTT